MSIETSTTGAFFLLPEGSEGVVDERRIAPMESMEGQIRVGQSG